MTAYLHPRNRTHPSAAIVACAMALAGGNLIHATPIAYDGFEAGGASPGSGQYKTGTGFVTGTSGPGDGLVGSGATPPAQGPDTLGFSSTQKWQSGSFLGPGSFASTVYYQASPTSLTYTDGSSNVLATSNGSVRHLHEATPDAKSCGRTITNQPTPGSVTYYSFLLRYESEDNAWTSTAELAVGQANGVRHIGVRITAGAQLEAFAASPGVSTALGSPLAQNQDHFIVVRLEEGDTMHVWLNPPLDAEPALVEADATISGDGFYVSGNESFKIDKLALAATLNNSGASNPEDFVFFDEFRIGTTYADVTPTGAVGDFAPPTWIAGWPQVNDVTATGTTARARIDEVGTAYYVVVPDGATPPTSTQVIAGTDGGDVAATAAGSIALTADTENSAAITGLTPGTAYDVYFVAQDDEPTPNVQGSPAPVLNLIAGSLVTYEFSTDANPTTEGLNTSSSAITGAGLAASAWSSTGKNYFGRQPSATPVTSYVSFTITADSGYTLDLTQLTYNYELQSQSGSTFTFETRSSVDGFASAIPGTYSLNPSGQTASLQNASFDLSGGGYDGLSSIEFRLYVTSNLPTIFNDIIRWDNIILSGTASLAVVDITPPVWEATYPQVTNVTDTGATARAAINEIGTAYFVVVPDGAIQPTPAEVAAGTGAGGSGELDSGSIALSIATPGSASIGNLSPGTAYDVYFVASDDTIPPNLQTTVVKVDITTTLGLSPYEQWANGGGTFAEDDNGDGIDNGMAFLLGAADPNEDATGRLPTVSTDGSGGLVLTFSMLNAANRGDATVSTQHSSDLGVTDAWDAAGNVALVPEGPGTGIVVGAVTFDVTENGNLNDVVATIPGTEGAGGKLFGQLVGAE